MRSARDCCYLLFSLFLLFSFFGISHSEEGERVFNYFPEITNSIAEFNEKVSKNWERVERYSSSDTSFPKSNLTKEGKANVFLHAFIAIHLDREIFPYLLDYYITQHSIPGKNVLLIFHLDPIFSLEQQKVDLKQFTQYYRPLLRKYGVEKYQLWYGAFSAVEVKKVEAPFLLRVLPDDGWLVRIDSDEFITPPFPVVEYYRALNRPLPNLVDFITLLDEFGFNHLKGHFVDRFAADCSLRPIIPFASHNHSLPRSAEGVVVDRTSERQSDLARPSLFDQFPCKTNFTLQAGAHTQKASINRSLFRTSVGNHCLLYETGCFFGSAEISRLAQQGRYQHNDFFLTLTPSNFAAFFKFLATKNQVGDETHAGIMRSLPLNTNVTQFPNKTRFIYYVHDLQLEVNHFKWTSALRDKLNKRILELGNLYLDKPWSKESESILSFFDSEGVALKEFSGCPCGT